MPTPSSHAFAEKVALITDGANPIGRAAAMQLALYGCFVIVGFSEETPENFRALEELKSLGTLANAVKSDVSTSHCKKSGNRAGVSCAKKDIKKTGIISLF